MPVRQWLRMSEPEDELVRTLRHRVRKAVADSGHAVEWSQRLAAARRLLRERRLLRHCAWCGCVSFGSGWTSLDQLPGFVPESVRDRATHGVCPGCLEQLQRQEADRVRERRG